MERIIFHHNGREYTIYDTLTADEIRAIITMGEERDKKLNALNLKSTKRYFEDTDKMVGTILRKCFHMTDRQIAEMEQFERRNLAYAFIRFLATANNFPNRL